MGNRAVITTEENFKNNGIGVYLHWNGGMDSVEGFLKYCKLKKYRPPDKDCYGWAYLVATIANYFGDGLCVGVDVCNNLDCDNWDNGVYFIKDWEIVGRAYAPKEEQHSYSINTMLDDIDSRQPVHIFNEELTANSDAINDFIKFDCDVKE